MAKRVKASSAEAETPKSDRATHTLASRAGRNGTFAGECQGCGWSASSFPSSKDLIAAHAKHLAETFQGKGN